MTRFVSALLFLLAQLAAGVVFADDASESVPSGTESVVVGSGGDESVSDGNGSGSDDSVRGGEGGGNDSGNGSVFGVAGATLRFDFLYNNFKVGDVVETFRTDADGGYVLESHAKATGLAKVFYGDVIRASSGRLHPEFGLLPERYDEKRGPRPRQSAEFDRGRGVVALRRGEDERREEMLSGVVHDYLSAIYLSYVLGGARSGKIVVTDGWRLKEYEYENAGTETVRTPAGEFEAVRISRSGKVRIFWLAKELGWLPVRVYVDDKGHIFESILTGAETAGR